MSFLISIVALVVAFLYGGPEALVLTLILGVLEVSLSFDNAVINATVLRRMSEFWQKIFLTIGIVIAVFGMRLVFPLAVVWIASGLNPVQALDLALNPPADGAAHFANGDPSYETIITDAHPQIAAFGGMFLLMLFLGFIFEDKEITWLSWLERPLIRIGKLDQLSVVIASTVLVITAAFIAHDGEQSTVMIAGVLGMISYILVNGLGELFNVDEEGDEPSTGPSDLAKAAGKAGFFLFLYLEVLDASFSFDGVIGAFAITADPILIALGLGLIGALFVRSLTVYLVRQGTLSEYVYLEHGAHWAIGALAFILMYSIGTPVPEIVTGMVGVVLIVAALITSIIRRRREGDDELPATADTALVDTKE
ncbi:membrane protein [Gordonia spumicola]|uniref:Membrane protein n=2 Tax=Gordonia spumicola TaxID=589161 RepID=A0A7I9V6J7_9ACTN|nr:membrane protein [Gordonia spumicola]